MPRDDWHKAKQRDIARKAAREFATGQPSSFDHISEDINRDGTTRDDGSIRPVKKRKKLRLAKKVRPQKTVDRTKKVDSRQQVEKAKATSRKLRRSPNDNNMSVVRSKNVGLLRSLVNKQKRLNGELRVLHRTMSRNSGLPPQSKQTLQNAQASILALRIQCDEARTFVVEIQKILAQASGHCKNKQGTLSKGGPNHHNT